MQHAHQTDPLAPRLRHLEVAGAAALRAGPRRLAWWDWPCASNEKASHVVVCVHGLSRQARDFDTLAQALQPDVRVVAVDVAGRGESDWLADPMAYALPTYVTDLAQLLRHLRDEDPVVRIDWVGTSMGGLIGMVLAAQPTSGLSRLVLNDVGPVIAWEAIRRIGSYVGRAPIFGTEGEAFEYLATISAAFGPHTPAQWEALSRPMLRPAEDGGWRLHYDPRIAEPLRSLLALDEAESRAALVAGEAALWAAYEAVRQPTLLLRGAESDLLGPSTVQAMTERGPRARCITFKGVGHAPTLMAADQVAAVRDFLLAPEPPRHGAEHRP